MKLRLVFLACAVIAGHAQSQTASSDDPALAMAAPVPMTSANPPVPMVPAAKPPLGAASAAARHEYLKRDRSQRLAEQAEDRAETKKKLDKARRQL